MPDVTFVPIFGIVCAQCEDMPIVGLVEKYCIRSTGLCGVCFFKDKTMIDSDLWNEVSEATE